MYFMYFQRSRFQSYSPVLKRLLTKAADLNEQVGPDHHGLMTGFQDYLSMNTTGLDRLTQAQLNLDTFKRRWRTSKSTCMAGEI